MIFLAVDELDQREKTSKEKHKSFMIPTIVIILLIVAFVYIEITTRHVPPITTTTTITTTSILVNNSSSLLNSLSNRSNSLYSINSSQNYGNYFNEQPTNSIYNYIANYSSANITYSYARIYGLNFTQYLIKNMLVLPANYALTIPRAYQNYTQPVIIEVSITSFTNATDLNNALKVFSENKNGTQQVSIEPFSINNTCPCINQTFNYTNITINSIPSVMQTIKPWYKTLEMNQIFIPYKNIQINVAAYGIIGKYNANYTVSIARHILETIESKTK